MSHPRPLLIPWLKSKIDSGKYPGVQWTNAERTEFSIPWKHALRQDSSQEDILIFKAWAEVSGNGRAQGDASIWKRNFRSALRVKGFKNVSDNKNDAANPHKVYRWPDETASPAKTSGSQDQESDIDLFKDCGLPTQESQDVPFEEYLYLPEDQLFNAPAHQDILQECLRGLNIDPAAEAIADLQLPPEQQQHPQNVPVIGAHASPEQQQQPMGGAVGGACEGGVGGELAEQFLHTITKTRDGDSFRTEFRVLVYYRGVKVLEQHINNEAGVRLVYRPDLVGPVVDPDSGLSLVSLPLLGTMPDRTQAALTQRILDKLGEGLDVGVSGHVVYGQRRGEIKAFWSFSKFDHSRQPQEISKLHPQPLFLFKDFVRGILNFIEGRESPPCSIIFCLGEKWPDPDNRPWEKKLITVEIVLTSMEFLKNMAVDGGASSLKSEELQMSLEEMMETC